MTELSVGVPLCSLKIEERENDYAEIGEAAPASAACKDPNQSQSIEPPSRTMGACNELPLSQSHAETGAIDGSCIEMSSERGGGGCCDFAEETLPLSQLSETDPANVNQVAVQSDKPLKESAGATCIEEDVRAIPGENYDIEAASSSTTTYNAVTNFQVGSSGSEMNTGDFWTYGFSKQF